MKIISKDLILGDVKVSYGLEQHFDYDGNRIEAEIDEFQYTFSYHSGTGYFPERNYITISYNAATDKMVGIDIVLDNLIKTEETVKGTTIQYDLEIARTNNPNYNFFAAYNLVNGSYRPAIYKMNANYEAEVYKQY